MISPFLDQNGSLEKQNSEYFRPVCNSPSVVIRPSVCALVALFLYTVVRLSSSFLHRSDAF